MDLSMWMMSSVAPSSRPQSIGSKITQVCPLPVQFESPTLTAAGEQGTDMVMMIHDARAPEKTMLHLRPMVTRL
jgi:hypothetical protein